MADSSIEDDLFGDNVDAHGNIIPDPDAESPGHNSVVYGLPPAYSQYPEF